VEIKFIKYTRTKRTFGISGDLVEIIPIIHKKYYCTKQGLMGFCEERWPWRKKVSSKSYKNFAKLKVIAGQREYITSIENFDQI
jgi:hypothetical protein